MNSSEEKNSKPQCEFDQNFATLRELPHFHKLPVELLRALALHCRQQSYHVGEDVFEQGALEERAYVVLKGSAGVFRTDDGAERRLSGVDQGRVLCTLSLLGKVERLFTLRAETELLLLTIPGDKIMADIIKSEAFCRSFLQSTASSVIGWEKGLLARLAHGEHGEDDFGVSLV